MFCKIHPTRLAHDKCSACGDPICLDCHRSMNGKVYCPNCLPETVKPPRKAMMRNPVLAAILGVFPGLGQVYNNEILKGLLIFFLSWMIVPWLYGIYDAYAVACRVNNRDIVENPAPALWTGCLVMTLLIFGMFSAGPLFIVNGIPQLMRQVFGNAPEQYVKHAFEQISGALQAYKQDHGNYPENENDLYFGDITYLTEMYCDSTQSHYRFVCDFHHDGYEIKAIPLKKGLPAYRMRTGPVVERFNP